MSVRPPLFQRLPEIYRIRDTERTPAGQLEAYLGILDEAQSAIHANIDALYHDFFIETCDDWVIPYIADLLGVSHLSGDPRTLRADVARTVHHRRRKGTLGAVESLVFALSGWAVHTVEMRERLAWHQHVNHLRPGVGGLPPQETVLSTSAPQPGALPAVQTPSHISGPARGGTVTVRDPATLAFVNTAFDPFGHVVDLKPPTRGVSGYNLPNLAIFLWRLEDYLVPVSQPGLIETQVQAAPPAGFATRAVRVELHPVAEPMLLFNTHRYHADDEPPNLTLPDAVPGPMPAARLTTGRPAGRPAQYVSVDAYAPPRPARPGAGAVGLTLHLPAAQFTGVPWTFRGANLYRWERCLQPRLRANEIVIDPRGRVVFGLAGPSAAARAAALETALRVSATYGFSGPTGAHPVPRAPTPGSWLDAVPVVRVVDFHANPNGLRDALADLHQLAAPLIVEIRDSMTHDLDLDTVVGTVTEAGLRTLLPSQSVWIRAASGERPVIRLARPLAFRPSDVTGPGADALMSGLTVRLEGLYLSADYDPATPLIARAAVHRLEIEQCTLDPGGAVDLENVRRPIRRAMACDNTYGFPAGPERDAFDQVPEIVLRQTVAGPLALDDGYRLYAAGSIIDAGTGVGAVAPALAVHAATGDPETGWGPDLTLGLPDDYFAQPPPGAGSGLTCFGRMRVESATGSGGVWVHRLEVHNTLAGCLRYSYFSGDGDRLPQHHGCVFGGDARLEFTSETWGRPGYAQPAAGCDRRLLEQGPGNDEMGAFGYLLNTHRWKNVNIRLREFVPVGVRALLIPIT
jgi:hypothetical protein